MITFFKAILVGILLSSGAFAMKVSEAKLENDINTFKVETKMGVFHWESDDGKSGWASAFDLNGKDWLQAGPKGRGVGKNSQYRGLPNSGADDWGHPSRKQGHNVKGTTNKIVGEKEGDKIVIESENPAIKGRWHCYDTHIALEVVSLTEGKKYHFLYEGTPGGTIHTEKGIIQANGEQRKIQEGWFKEKPDWPAGDVGEWYYFLDPNEKHNFFMAQTPATEDKGELWYQKGNMDLASFGRGNIENKPSFTDIERRFAFGFIPYEWEFEKAKKHIEDILKDPLKAKPVSIESKKGRLNQGHIPKISVNNGVAEITFSGLGDVSLQLFNVTGKLVNTWSAGHAPSFKIEGLNRGVYFLKSITGTGKTHLQKIILGL